MHKNNCRVCGFGLSYPPWGEDDNSPTWEICACCGTEFGYEDCTMAGIKAQRERWLSGGQIWFDETAKPKEWSFDKQKSHIPTNYK